MRIKVLLSGEFRATTVLSMIHSALICSLAFYNYENVSGSVNSLLSVENDFEEIECLHNTARCDCIQKPPLNHLITQPGINA
jgi:hypothetical protein